MFNRLSVHAVRDYRDWLFFITLSKRYGRSWAV